MSAPDSENPGTVKMETNANHFIPTPDERRSAVMRGYKFWRVLLSLTAVILMSCNSINEPSMGNNHSFQLVILEKDVSHDCWQRMGYTQESSWPVFQQAYLSSENAYVITEVGIESYDWSKQNITLTPSTTEELINSFGCSYDIVGCLNSRVFVVVVDNTPLYGGIFIFPGPAMAIRFPVIYPNYIEKKIVFTVRPAFSWYSDPPTDESLWGPIKDERIADIFSDLGKLTR
jgi:hypothetical protein